MKDAEEKETRFSFYKGSDNVVALKDGSPFDWERAASAFRAGCCTVRGTMHRTVEKRQRRRRKPGARMPHSRNTSNSSLTNCGRLAPVVSSVWAKKLGRAAAPVGTAWSAQVGGARSAPGRHRSAPCWSGRRWFARAWHGESGVVQLLRARAPAHPPSGGHPCPEPWRRPRSRAARSARPRAARPRRPKTLIHRRAISASHARRARQWVSRLDRRMRCPLSALLTTPDAVAVPIGHWQAAATIAAAVANHLKLAQHRPVQFPPG